MFVALEPSSDTAVTGEDVAEQRRDPVVSDRTETPYQCLLCGEQMEYAADNASALESFQHRHESCINTGNVGAAHQLAQEVVAKTLYNWLPTVDQRPEIDLERRVGTKRDFIIADVLVAEPIPIAVEIVHLAPLNLRRRLQRLFTDGYSGLFVFLSNGRVSADRVEHHLDKLADLHVGRFDAQTLTLTFGSLVSPGDVPFDSPAWDQLPGYLV